MNTEVGPIRARPVPPFLVALVALALGIAIGGGITEWRANEAQAGQHCECWPDGGGP
jgi:hypothetical protein